MSEGPLEQDGNHTPTGTTQGSRPCTARKRVHPWLSRDGFREHRPWRVARSQLVRGALR